MTPSKELEILLGMKAYDDAVGRWVYEHADLVLDALRRYEGPDYVHPRSGA